MSDYFHGDTADKPHTCWAASGSEGRCELCGLYSDAYIHNVKEAEPMSDYSQQEKHIPFWTPEYSVENLTDDNGNPAGGTAHSKGIEISWQHGPLGRGADRFEKHNGAFVETVIDICIKRLEFFQGSKFACDENHEAIYYLQQALLILNERTAKREARGVEGLHEV